MAHFIWIFVVVVFSGGAPDRTFVGGGQSREQCEVVKARMMSQAVQAGADTAGFSDCMPVKVIKDPAPKSQEGKPK